MLLADLVATSVAVTATRSRKQKIAALADCLHRMDADEVAVGAGYLAGIPRQPRLDVGWALLREVVAAPAADATLTLVDVDLALEALTQVGGAGSRTARRAIVTRLLAAATAEEQRFLRGLILGELRQGALAGVMAQAIAQAWDVGEAPVRRALLVNADLGDVAAAARRGGAAELAALRLTLFRPLSPMLASTAAGIAEALDGLDRARVDYKLDGARVQVHRAGEDVAVYTRNLRNITTRVPSVVATARDLPVMSAVLDGEVLMLNEAARPLPFSETMSRFGSDDADALGQAATLKPFFFDILHVDGQDLLDEPLARRQEALAAAVPASWRVPGEVASGVDAGEAVLRAALDAGHEGVVVKALDAPYDAGRRGSAWRKVKPVHTLDLVVLGAEWGSGRRQGWLSNLHLGARDGDGFVMLGKTFKGMTDHMLAWQTARLLELEVNRTGHVVLVHPELVVEVAFDGVQRSSRYAGGVTLRFARVRRYREDKPAAAADTLDMVRAFVR